MTKLTGYIFYFNGQEWRLLGYGSEATAQIYEKASGKETCIFAW